MDDAPLAAQAAGQAEPIRVFDTAEAARSLLLKQAKCRC
jgi:hypothetical protein